MSNQYEKISISNPTHETENFKLPEDIGNPDPSSPGQQILNLAISYTGSLDATRVEHLYRAFLETPLRLHWEWRPSGEGYSANRYGVLDGSKKFGECKHFALALWGLARAPKPFGLGLTHSQVQWVNYPGALGNGFVSNHDHRFLELSKNVKRPDGNLDRLYYWENHKTVRYNSVYYDVCYGTTYDNQSNMELYVLTGIYAPEGPTKMLAEKARRVADGRYFWFKRLQPSDNVTNPHRAWLGPIDETTFEVKYASSKELRVQK